MWPFLQQGDILMNTVATRVVWRVLEVLWSISEHLEPTCEERGAASTYTVVTCEDAMGPGNIVFVPGEVSQKGHIKGP